MRVWAWLKFACDGASEPWPPYFFLWGGAGPYFVAQAIRAASGPQRPGYLQCGFGCGDRARLRRGRLEAHVFGRWTRVAWWLSEVFDVKSFGLKKFLTSKVRDFFVKSF